MRFDDLCKELEVGLRKGETVREPELSTEPKVSEVRDTPPEVNEATPEVPEGGNEENGGSESESESESGNDNDEADFYKYW